MIEQNIVISQWRADQIFTEAELMLETLTSHDILRTLSSIIALSLEQPSLFSYSNHSQGSDLRRVGYKRVVTITHEENLIFSKNTFRRYYAWAGNYLKAVIRRSCGALSANENKEMLRMIFSRTSELKLLYFNMSANNPASCFIDSLPHTRWALQLTATRVRES